MRNKKIVLLISLLSLILVLVGCSNNDSNNKTSNQPPKIDNVTPESPHTVGVNETVQFSVTASDQDNDNLSYSWTETGGNLGSTVDSTVEWTAPAGSGQASVTVTVTDGKATTNYTWDITVGKSVIEITDNINSTTTWEGDKVYLIKKSSLDVNASLEIKPGAIIKFESGGNMTVTSNGYLKAEGIVGVPEETIAKPIIFTSVRDDEHGGDTNGDGDITSADVADWEYISIKGGSSLKNNKFYYGGGGYDYALRVEDNSSNITDSTFAHNNGKALDAAYAPEGTVIERNVFYDNEKPLTINGLFSLDDSNTFHNPDNQTETNDKNGIYVRETVDVTTAIDWQETEVPFVIGKYSTYERFDIAESGQLNLASNVIMKFLSDAKMRVYGSIIADSVVFTSIRDDEHGGDTNGDGDITSPSAGDWYYVRVEGNGEFTNSEFYYGGGDSHDSTLLADGANVTVKGSIFAHNKGINKSALDLAYAEADTIVSNNVFYDNEQPLVINAKFSLDDSNSFHNPNDQTETNDYNSIYVRETVDVTTAIDWKETEVPFVIGKYSLYDRFDIQNTGSLTLGDNVIFKFLMEAKLRIYGGSLNYSQSNNFTSIRDDSFLGDTNNDGDSTTPTVDDWEGIYYDSSDTWENGGNIYYDSHAQNTN